MNTNQDTDDNEVMAALIDYANRSLRDSADQDYISARAAYRHGFDQQFRWNSLQAVEKYLKAILLYNRRSAKCIRHNLREALKRVRGIPDLDFQVPKHIEEFIEFLDDFGADRYFSHPTHIPLRALPTLDHTVWTIRRYCFYMRQEFWTGGRVINVLDQNKRKISDGQFIKFPNRYRIANGYLEKVKEKRLPAYDSLVWKNLYFGKITKHRITITERLSMSNPSHFLIPEHFKELKEFVDFPKDVISVLSDSKNCRK